MNEWMPRAEWEALVKGEGCPLCHAMTSSEVADDYAYTIADLPSGRLRLGLNQWVSGYCTLVCRQHVREPWELSDTDRHAFFEDMSRAGHALERVLASAKMNFEILGNAVPHLHAHIIPRYYGDP